MGEGEALRNKRHTRLQGQERGGYKGRVRLGELAALGARWPARCARVGVGVGVGWGADAISRTHAAQLCPSAPANTPLTLGIVRTWFCSCVRAVLFGVLRFGRCAGWVGIARGGGVGG